MPQVRFEPTIQVFQRSKIIHALDRAAIVIGNDAVYPGLISTLRFISNVTNSSTKLDESANLTLSKMRYTQWDIRTMVYRPVMKHDSLL
jgi:hypothetical protein